MESIRNGRILERAAGLFRELEKVLLELLSLRSRIITEMEALALEYRKEFRGSRLVLYEKKRRKKPHLRALYWAVLGS
jgi:hypothetical protein